MPSCTPSSSRANALAGTHDEQVRRPTRGCARWSRQAPRKTLPRRTRSGDSPTKTIERRRPDRLHRIPATLRRCSTRTATAPCNSLPTKPRSDEAGDPARRAPCGDPERPSVDASPAPPRTPSASCGARASIPFAETIAEQVHPDAPKRAGHRPRPVPHPRRRAPLPAPEVALPGRCFERAYRWMPRPSRITRSRADLLIAPLGRLPRAGPHTRSHRRRVVARWRGAAVHIGAGGGPGRDHQGRGRRPQVSNAPGRARRAGAGWRRAAAASPDLTRC